MSSGPTSSGHRRTGAWALVAVVALVALAASACSSGDDGTLGNGSSGSTPGTVSKSVDHEAGAGTPKAGGKLAFGLSGETSGWNPFKGQWGAPAFIVTNAIFDPLASFDEAGVAQPYLAKSFTPNSTFTEWTIGLRPGVTFHNGTPLDAAAVVKNLSTARTAGLTSAVYANVTAIDPVDASTVKVTMSKPWATFPLTLASQTGYMAAPEQIDSPDHDQDRPIGTGPFRFVEWVRDDHLTVTKNASYWRPGLPRLEAVEFRTIVDSQARDAALRSSQLDAMEVTNADSLVRADNAAKAGDFQYYSDAGLENDEAAIALNTSKPPFNSPVAREAVARAIDQKALSAINNGGYPPAWGPITEGNAAYLSPEQSGYPAYDPDKARQLAQQYQQETGQALSFSMLLPPDPALASSGQVLQAQLQAAGIDMKLDLVEQSTLGSRVLTGDYTGSIWIFFSTPTLDRSYAWVASTPPPTGIALNVTRFVDPALTGAFDDSRATIDPAKRIAAYQEIQKRLAADLQMLFLSHRVRGIVYANDVYGFKATTAPDADQPTYAGFYSTPFLTSVWIKR